MSDSSYNLTHDLSIRGLKLIDIGYLFTASSIVGYASARLLAHTFPFKKEKYKKTKQGKIKLALEILLEMAIIGVVFYLARQIIQALPFPFDGWKGINAPSSFKGYNHKSLKEYGNPFPIAFFIVLYQDNLRAKISYFTELNNF
jgi:hypothetical protein